jgi:adenosylcobinamide kinase/adenosylcobinamide-phosphate guanylyltransferase
MIAVSRRGAGLNSDMGRLVFVTGGARSGKSSYAQQRAEVLSGRLLYVATATIGDAEMAARVRRHQLERDERWLTLEAQADLTAQLSTAAKGCSAVLVDCLTLWLNGRMAVDGTDADKIATAGIDLLAALQALPATVFVVSNELGCGIVPENRLARSFRDLHGLLNQRFAAAADEAWLVVSGLPLQLKSNC